MIQRPFQRRSARLASVTALALLALVLAVQTWRRAHRAEGNDLTSYLAAAGALAAGENPYAVETPFPYIYPLFPALALIPLAALPYGAAVAVWFGLSAGALGWTLAWIARRESAGRPRGDALATALIVLILLAEVVQNNLLNGQINFVVVAACMASLALASGPPWRPGAAWAVAIAIKIVPLALAPWWLRRRRAMVVLAALAVTIALALAAVAVAGLPALDWSRAYARDFLAGTLAAGTPDDSMNFSLYGIIQSALPALPWLPLACGVVVLAAVAAVDARRATDPAAGHVAFALYLAAIPLASPKSETHHLAFAIPAAYIGALRVPVFRAPGGDWRRRTLIAAAALFWIGHLWLPVRNWCWFGFLVLLAIVTASLMRREAPSETETAEAR